MRLRQDVEEVRLLRRLCSLRGLTQREVALRLGVTEALVSMWAHGKRKPGEARMAALR
jgi:transcriptional regulator with XRE-family HTH domain